jgi:hypothetical protein
VNHLKLKIGAFFYNVKKRTLTIADLSSFFVERKCLENVVVSRLQLGGQPRMKSESGLVFRHFRDETEFEKCYQTVTPID